MESFHTSESRAADAQLNDSLSEDDDDAAPDQEVLEIARIDEYRQETHHEEDSLESCLGTRVGRLLEFALRYEQYINKLLMLSAAASQELPVMQRAMNTYLNILRQMDRLLNLKARHAENRRKGTKIKSPSPRFRK